MSVQGMHWAVRWKLLRNVRGQNLRAWLRVRASRFIQTKIQQL